MADVEDTSGEDTFGKIIHSTGDFFNIFGMDKSADNAIKKKLAESRARQEAAIQQLKDFIQKTSLENKGMWSDYGNGLEGYSGKLDSALDNQRGLFSDLSSKLSNYRNIEDLFKEDPTLAKHDEDSRFKESQNLSKIGALTGTKETAEEQLMRLMSRQAMEGELKSQRDSVASSLKERGVYGGGAELSLGLAAQQEQAGRREIDDTAANANAAKRGMAAMQAYQQGASSMSAADDALSKFNSSLLQQNQAAQANARATDNSQKANRAIAVNNAGTQINQQATANANSVRGDQRATVQGATGTNNNAVAQLGELTGMQINQEAGSQAATIAGQKPKGFLDGLFNMGWS